MFPDPIAPAQDFEQQLRACINFMCQDDAIGQTSVFKLDNGTLHIRQIATLDLVDLLDTDIERYDMILFDGCNTSGAAWKHVFFPRRREHYFEYVA